MKLANVTSITDDIIDQDMSPSERLTQLQKLAANIVHLVWKAPDQYEINKAIELVKQRKTGRTSDLTASFCMEGNNEHSIFD